MSIWNVFSRDTWFTRRRRISRSKRRQRRERLQRSRIKPFFGLGVFLHNTLDANATTTTTDAPYNGSRLIYFFLRSRCRFEFGFFLAAAIPPKRASFVLSRSDRDWSVSSRRQKRNENVEPKYKETRISIAYSLSRTLSLSLTVSFFIFVGLSLLLLLRHTLHNTESWLLLPL